MISLNRNDVILAGAPLPGSAPAVVQPARCQGAQALAKSYPIPVDPAQAGAWLQAEAFATQKVQHVCVPKVLGSWQGQDGTAHLILQRPAGRRWDEIVRIGQQRHSYMAARAWDEATRHVVRSLAHCIETAHFSGVAHGNLAPDSVWVDLTAMGELDIKVVDFLGSTPLVPGPRLRFAAPEQLAGQAADARTDVYRLALFVYFSLTGTTPWPTDDLAAARTARLAPVDRVPDERAAAAWALVSKWPEVARTLQVGLQADPNKRPQTIAQFVSLLGLGWALPEPRRSMDVGYAVAGALAMLAAVAVSWPAEDSRLTRALLDRQPLAACSAQLPVLAQQVCAKYGASRPQCQQALTFVLGREECPNRIKTLRACLGEP